MSTTFIKPMESSFLLIAVSLFASFFVCKGQNPDTSPVTSPSQYPFMASIQGSKYYTDPDRTGVILDEFHILTTSELLYSTYYPNVLVGQLNRTNDDETSQQLRNISQIIRHPDNCSPEDDMVANNIAIVKLSTPLEFNENVQPIKIPELWSPTIGEATIVGWKYNTSTVLHELQSVPVLDVATCRSFIGRIKYRSAHVCAGYLRPDGTASNGQALDFTAGSVLLCPQGEERVACGVLSYIPNPPMCQSDDLGYPIIFTEVSKYSDWIQSVLERPNPTTATITSFPSQTVAAL